MTESTTSTPRELRFTRIVDAPRSLVYRCMIEPEHLTHFWGPIGVSTPVETITVDPRPGGAFETVMVNDADGSQYPTRAVYLELVEPERLVWVEPDVGVTTTTTFEDLGGDRTQIHIHQSDVPESFTTAQARAGFSSSLERFAGYLATVR